MDIFGNQNKRAETLDGTEVPMNVLLKQEETKLSKKNAILIFLLYFIGFTWGLPFLIAILLSFLQSLNFLNDHMYDAQIIIQMIGSIVFMIIIVILSKDLLKESYYAIRKNKLFLLLVIAVMYVFMLYSTGSVTTIVNMITKADSSANQVEVVNLIIHYPYFAIFYVVVFAPIVEEIVFRGSIFRRLRTKYGFWLATGVSCLLFGFMHVMLSLFTGNFLDLLNILVYGTMAFSLCAAYEITGSIHASILMHLIHNSIATLVILLGLS